MLTDLTTAQALLGPADRTPPSQLNALLAAADAAVKAYCKRDFEQADYTEFYSGTGFRWFVLKQRPVQTITSLWVDHAGQFGTVPGSFDAAHLMTQGVDYALEYDTHGAAWSTSGRVIRINTVWAEMSMVYVPGRVTQDVGPAFGNVKVAYTAGYPSGQIPLDLGYAVCELAMWMKRTIKFGGPVQAEKLGDYGYHIGKVGLKDAPELGSTRQILARYRDFTI